LTRVLAEGYLGQKKEFTQDPWEELYNSMRLGLIIQEKVSGIEKVDGKENLVVFLGPIKGVIPEDEIGLLEGQIPQFAVGNTIAFKVKHCDRDSGIAYLSRKEATKEMSNKTWQELKRDAKELIELSAMVKELNEKIYLVKPKEENDTDKDISDSEEVSEGTESAAEDIQSNEDIKLTEEEKREIQQEIKNLRSKMREVGPTRTCAVRHVFKYGAYIDIGGVSAFIPRHEISWGFVEDARDILQSGDAFDVKLIDINDRGVIASLKLLLPDPWENVDVKYTKGGVYTGKVVKEVTKGMLVELEPGITAFAPHLPFGNPFPGSEVLFKAGRINSEDRRMSGWVIKVTKRAG
jgi:ribosomal protein S1